MDEEQDICCTCLSKDRFLYPSAKYAVFLAAIHVEINTSRGGICWECKSLIDRLTKFRSQVVEAQQLLRSCDQIDNLKSYSALTYSKKYYYDTHFDPTTNIQITCTETGPILIKQEVTEPDDQDSRNDVECSNVVQKPNELPRITLVQSITEQACERNDRFQPLTEIIELNIPIPQTINVENVQKENGLPDNMGTFRETNDSGKDTAVFDEEKRTEQMSKEKDTITVKVKVVTEDGHDVRIKEEPLSDDDDVQIDTNDLILSNTEYNSQENLDVNESPKIIIKEEQNKTWKRSVLLVYNRLREHKYASRFVSPITDAMAPEYSKVVKRPMDLLTIKKNIQSGVVRTTAEFHRDILLMLTNALMYNDSETAIHHMAKDMLTEAQDQLVMLLEVHAQETLFKDTPLQRLRRRRDSKCSVDITTPVKRPRLSTTPRNNKMNNNIPIQKPTPKTTPARIILTPVKVENIDNIEKYTSHLENTPPKRSRRISVMKVKECSSKANKNKPLLNPKVEKVVVEKEILKPKKSKVSTTPKVKIEPVAKMTSKVTARRNTVKEKHQMEKEPLVASKITSKKGKQQTQNEIEPIVPPKITSRRNTSKVKSESIVASKISSRRNSLKIKKLTQSETEPIVAKITSLRKTLKGKQQMQEKPETIVATKITSRRSTLKGKRQKLNEPEPIVLTKIASRRKTLKVKLEQQNAPESIVATKITSRRNTLKGKQQKQFEPEPKVATKITSRRNTLTGKQKTQKSQDEATVASKTTKHDEQAFVPPKITPRRDTLKEHYQMLMEHNYVLAPEPDPTPIVTKNIKQELISLQNPEMKTQEDISDILDAGYMDDILVDTETHDEELSVAITNTNQRDMTTAQAQIVKRALEDKILNIALDARNFAPRFKGKPIIVDGVIKLWCECKKTKAWLNDTVDKLPRKYGRFVVKKQSEVPKKVKSALIVPSYNKVEFIMRLLKAQNNGTFIDSWVVYSAEQRGENMFIVVGIPQAALPKLRSRRYKLAYNLGSIAVMFYDADGKLVCSPPK